MARLLIAISFALSSAPLILWRAVKMRPSVILATEPSFATAPMALLAGCLSGARVVLHVQDLEIEAAFAVGHLRGEGLLAVARGVRTLLLRRFSHIVTISDKMAAALRSAGVDNKRLTIVRNWVDLTTIYPLTGPNPFRDEWGVIKRKKVVLYSGSIGAKQALDQVVAAAALLIDNSSIHFVIAGEGPAKASLMRSAPPNVMFLPLQAENRLRDFLSAADVHVLPQSRDAADLVLPSKLGGMLASARPIVAQADEGTELHTFLGGAAILVPPGDPALLAAAITRACTDPDTGLVARRNLAESLSAQGALARWMDVLELGLSRRIETPTEPLGRNVHDGTSSA